MDTILTMEKEQIGMLSYSLKFNRMLYEKGVKDLDHEDSLNSPSELINPPNWIFGHVIATRADLLKKLEVESGIPEKFASTYRRGSAKVTIDTAYNLKEIDGYFIKTDQILEGLFEESSPIAKLNTEVAEMILSYFLHEAYHLGQVGLCRRFLGKESI